MHRFELGNIGKNIETPELDKIENNHESFDQVKEYINSLFDKSEEEYYEDLLNTVIDYNEEDVVLDFDFDDIELTNKLNEMKTHWNEMPQPERKEAIVEFAALLSDKLNLAEVPDITFFNNSDLTDLGGFIIGTNIVKINEGILDNYSCTIDTVAHELRHAYQYERAEMGETYIDDMYKCNFDNYIFPIVIEGYCYNFMEYYNQFIEVEARAFAGKFIE